MDGGSYDLARERFVDMDRRLRPLRAGSMALLGAALIAAGPWVGWWTLAPLAATAASFAIVDRLLDRVARPEWLLGGAWAVCQGTIAASAAAVGGPQSPALCWLVIPVVTLGARFDARGLLAGVALTAALMVGVALGVDAGAVAAEPQRLIFPLAMLGAVALLSSALMRSDREHRASAVLDGLTGMLNRTSLAPRAAELAEQATVTGEPVGLIVGDVDGFKGVNDRHGHARGDVVLKDVAYLLRKNLRAFDLAYRLGGEEFVVLLPGADAQDSAVIAERLRSAVSEAPVAGLDVTMSFGVAASRRGSGFHYEPVFTAADAALYEAKRGGRDRVCLAGSGHVGAPREDRGERRDHADRLARRLEPGPDVRARRALATRLPS